MGMWIHVFCQAPEPLSLGEVADFIVERVFFDETPIVRNADDRAATSWAFEVIYDPKIRPVQISFGETDETTRATIDELLEEHLPAEPTPAQTALSERLRKTRQELVLHFSSDISEDCWAMLDALEAFVAKRLDGLVYASEGLYDETLALLWRFERN